MLAWGPRRRAPLMRNAAFCLVLMSVLSCGDGQKAAAPPSAPLPAVSGGHSCTTEKSDCPQASIDKYSTCVVTTCDSTYKACFGDGYASGTFGGPCKELLGCAMVCASCDQACIQKCSDQFLVGTCKDCITGPLTTCVVSAITDGKCALPCVKVGSGCAGLSTCCNSMVGQDKTDCLKVLDAYKNLPLGAGDTSCDAALTSVYKPAGKCI